MEGPSPPDLCERCGRRHPLLLVGKIRHPPALVLRLPRRGSPRFPGRYLGSRPAQSAATPFRSRTRPNVFAVTPSFRVAGHTVPTRTLCAAWTALRVTETPTIPVLLPHPQPPELH